MRTRRQKLSEDHQSITRHDSQSESLPIDLIIEILSKLPVKTIARCRCVSKLWSSTILRPEFVDVVMTRSATTQPQLLFACRKHSKVFFYSSPQPNEESSSLPTDSHMSFPVFSAEIHPPLHGLICLEQTRHAKEKRDMVLMVCNPSTGQSLILPKVKTRKVNVASFFGYDPVGKQFKMLSMAIPRYGKNRFSQEHQVLTLGDGKLLWRMVECSIPHCPLFKGVCIDGVLYYAATVGVEEKDTVVSFDIRLEKFKLIEKEKKVGKKLVNYKGKLATISKDTLFVTVSVPSRSFELCVLEDAEKHEWSTHTYVLPPLSLDIHAFIVMQIVGVTRTGEIVLSPCQQFHTFYLIYYNLEQNTIRKVEVQGIDMSKYHDVHPLMHHVEDVKLGRVFQTSQL